MNVGVISDTHGMLRPEALTQLNGSDCIIHAGDIGSPGILHALQKLAPVHAIRGNVDVERWARSLPSELPLNLGGVEVLVIHNRAEMGKLAKGIRVVVFGHSHQPLIEQKGGVLYFNPGSAGPRRFRLPISLGRLTIGDGKVEPQIVPLG